VIHCTDILLALAEPLPQWLNFLAMALALLLVGFASFLWFALIRKKRSRRRKRRQFKPRRGEPHERRERNPTLAETGGLPPIREETKTEETPPPPP
jgi:hypothetical protein